MSQTATKDEIERNPEQALRVESLLTTEKPEPIGVETKNALLVVAALVMTATYQAVLQPPGGLWQDDVSGGSTAGKSVMASKLPSTYVMFIFFNSMGFYGSYLVIWSLLEEFPMKRELGLAMVALICTNDVSMGALAISTALNWTFVGISILMPLLFPLIVKLADFVDKLRGR